MLAHVRCSRRELQHCLDRSGPARRGKAPGHRGVEAGAPGAANRAGQFFWRQAPGRQRQNRASGIAASGVDRRGGIVAPAGYSPSLAPLTGGCTDVPGRLLGIPPQAGRPGAPVPSLATALTVATFRQAQARPTWRIPPPARTGPSTSSVLALPPAHEVRRMAARQIGGSPRRVPRIVTSGFQGGSGVKALISTSTMRNGDQ